MLTKIIIASGVAIGIAIAIPHVVGVTTATIALHQSGINPANASRVASQMDAARLRSAQDLLDDPLTNPNHMTIEDCRNGNSTTPCGLVRTFLRSREGQK